MAQIKRKKKKFKANGHENAFGEINIIYYMIHVIYMDHIDNIYICTIYTCAIYRIVHFRCERRKNRFWCFIGGPQY